MVNDKGEYITCANQSFGLIGSIVAQTQFDNCVSAAKEMGCKAENRQ